ncbi:MAG: AI-2E family transporter [Lachnospiraceae bacterium]|nr:AI-2E family transporter [Lachnospiraceae bacterium]
MKEKYSNYIKWGLTVVCTVTVCLVIFFLMFRYKDLADFLHKLSGILLPVIIGAIISYLLNPIVNFIERLLKRLFLRMKLSHRKAGNLSLGIAIFTSLALLFVLVYSIISLILPELYRNVSNFVSNFESYTDTVSNWFSNLDILKNNPALSNNLEQLLDKMTTSIEDWVSTALLGSLSGILSGLTFGIIGVFNTIIDIVVGLIVSVYILYSKRKYTGMAKKLTYAVFKPKIANTILSLAAESNKIFSGFISGKLLDSLIIGMICFIALSLFHMPYVLLISVIIGVTNIIPFFGPFIGAIPSAVLVLLSNPSNPKQAILFAVFILCLQQFDGNILGPKILGDSTGLSALMVVVAILIGGGFFGFMGMFLGVPVFAVINYLLGCLIHYLLKKKGLPTETISFLDLTSINEESGEMHYRIPETKTASGKQAVFTRHLKKNDKATEEGTVTDSLHAEGEQGTDNAKESGVSKKQKNRSSGQEKRFHRKNN